MAHLNASPPVGGPYVPGNSHPITVTSPDQSLNSVRTHDEVVQTRTTSRRATGRRYVALLTSDSTRRLQRLVRPFGFAIEACRPETWLDALNGPAQVCAIVDPAQLAPAQLAVAISRLRHLPRPAVIYAQLSPEGVNDALSLTKETGAAVMFQSGDESTTQLVRTLVTVGPPTDAAMLLEQLTPALGKLPNNLQLAISAMFAGDAAPQSPESLAGRAGLSRRSLDRWLGRAGLSSARLLTTAPLMLRAFRLLLETDLALRVIATVSGMRSTPRLRAGALQLVGLTPVQIREERPSMTALIDASVGALHAQTSSAVHAA